MATGTHEASSAASAAGKSLIPEFKTIQEEAGFWVVTHDTTDFEDEFTPVKVGVAADFPHRLLVELEPAGLDALSGRAWQHGVGTAPRARTWIREHLRRG